MAKDKLNPSESEQQVPEQHAESAAAEPSAERDVAAEDVAAEMETVFETATTGEVESIELLREQCVQANERVLRAQAELENYRKRATRDMLEERRYANLPLLRDLLPVVDNLDRAIEAAEKTHNTADLLEGVKMVAQQLVGVLQRYECVKIEALHSSFDPNLHEAISQLPSPDHPTNTVIAVTQTGYRLHDRVVRPPQVVVSSGNADGASSPDTDTTANDTAASPESKK